MQLIKVTSAIVNKTGVTLFLGDGDTKTLRSDGWRTKEIIETLMPQLIADGEAQINLESFTIEKALEKSDIVLTKTEGNKLAVTVGETTIQDAGRLTTHIERAAYTDGFKGFKEFMANFAKIDSEHSANDLLTFLEKGDLPIADDGSIVAYKVLRKAGDHFVDKHTGNVPQKLGSLVEMPKSKVNANRHTSCAAGLHICSVNYIKGFHYSGDVIALVKVWPQDVIAVPHSEFSKVRASSYHIVAVIPDEFYGELNGGSSVMNNPKAIKLLEEVVAGNHSPVLEIVNIGEHNKVTVTRVSNPNYVKKAVKARSLAKPKAIDVKEVKRAAAKIQAESAEIKKDFVKNVGKVVAKTAERLQLSKPKKPAYKHSRKAVIDAEYRKKLKKAIALVDKGASIRQVAEKLHISRDGLSAALKNR